MTDGVDVIDHLAQFKIPKSAGQLVVRNFFIEYFVASVRL